MDNDYLERRIATLERVVFPLPRLVDQIGIKLGQVDQKIQGMRGGGYGRCTTNLNGRLTGNPSLGNVPLPNSFLRIVGNQSGTDYGTFSVPTGDYSIDLQLDTADVSFDLYAIGPTSPRFNPTPPAPFNQFLQTSQCFPTTFTNMQCAVAAGYQWWSGPCNFPVPLTLNWTSSLHGTGTMTAAVAGNIWTSGVAGTFPTYAFGACTAKPAIPLQFLTQPALGSPAGSLQCTYPSASLGCPNPTGLGHTEAYSRVLIASPQCPDATGTIFDMTYTIPGGTTVIFGPSAQTFRIYEP